MRVQLTVNAEKLKNTARLPFQMADPYAIVTISGGPFEGTEVGRTETIQNTLNPTWTKILFADLNTAVFMPFRVSVYDDNATQKDELMAEANFEMTEVYQSPGNTQFEDVDGKGRIYVNVEESVRGNAVGTFTFHMRGLDIKNVESGPLGLGTYSHNHMEIIQWWVLCVLNNVSSSTSILSVHHTQVDRILSMKLPKRMPILTRELFDGIPFTDRPPF